MLESASDCVAHLALRHPLGWAAVAVGVFSAVLAAAAAGYLDRPTAFAALVVIAAAAPVPLLLRRLTNGIQARLDAALLECAALRSDLATLHETQEQLRHLANHDGLTDLPNRGLLYDRLEVAVKQAHRRKSGIGVLFLDIEDFKLVNDTYGHAAGDRLLVELAARLRSAVRAGDTVARLGGDEFVVLLDGVTGAEDAARVAATVLEGVQFPFRIDGHDVRVTASVGASVYPADGVCPDELLRSADAAMYRDKQRPAAARGEGEGAGAGGERG